MEKIHNSSLDSAADIHRRPAAADGIAVSIQSSQNITSDRKLVSLQDLLRKDIMAADMKWNLFVAASQSYRCDSCLKPFPSQYMNNGVKDIDSLHEVVSRTPELSKVMLHCNELVHNPLDPQVIDLLFWVLVQVKEFTLISVPKKDFGAILAQAGSSSAIQPPNHIFQVTIDPHSARLSKWTELAQGRNTWCGFHGSRLENFYSILCYGLQQHMTKRDLFGPGIYLSDELSVSLLYSPTGCASCHSLVGEHMSCIALCKILDHPDVKCRTKKGSDTNTSRSTSCNSVGGQVPETYYIVQNSDVVSVQYLLVYSNKRSSKRGQDASLVGWVKNHKMFTIIIAYILLLVSIGLANSPVAMKYLKIFLKKIGR